MRRIVCLAIIMSVVLMCFAVEVSSSFPSEEEFRLLKALGILSDDITEKSLTVDGGVLRIDAIKSAVKLAGAVNYGANSTKFSDIKEDVEDAEYVNAAREYGMIEGYGNNILDPYNYITYNEAIKILTIAAGYGEYAKSKGGYPTGYLIAANTAGITAGVKSTSSNKLKLSEFCKLAYNTLTADIMSISTDNGGYFGKVTDQNLLWTVFHTYIVKGVVTADKNTSIYFEKKVREGHIEIEGTLYRFNDDDGSYLGRFVRAYVKEDEANGDEAVLLYTDMNKNNVLTLDSDLIDSVRDQTKINYYENEESAKATSLEIAQGASYIYNGLFAGYFGTSYATEDELLLQNASYTFIDNDGDYVYDIVMVSKYSYFEVASVSTAANSFVDKSSGKNIEFVKDDKFRFKSGLECSVSSIAPGNILAVYLNKSETLDTDSRRGKEFIILTSFITGAAGKVSDDEIWIDAEISSEAGYYKINTDYITRLSDIENKDGRFLLDYRDKIIAFERNATFTQEYGYVIDAAAAKTGLNPEVILKILTEAGKVQIFICNNRIKFYDGKEETISPTKLFEKKETFLQKLIQFSVNNSGKLTSLRVPEEHVPGVNGDRFNFIPEATYRTGGGVLSNKYLVLGDAKIFVVPEKETAREAQEEFGYYGYRVGDVALLGNNADIKLELFSVDDRMRVGAILCRIETPAARIWPSYPLFVVEKIAKVINEYGEQVTKVFGYSGDKYVSYVFRSDNIPAITKRRGTFLPTDLAFGDIIQIGASKTGVIWDYKVLLDASDDGTFIRNLGDESPYFSFDGDDRNPTWAIAGYVAFAYQRVSEANIDYITFNIDDTNKKSIFGEKLRNIFLVTDDKVELAAFGDVRAGDRIFATWYDSVQTDLYIYR